MAEEHAPSYYLEEAPELVGEDHWNFLGTDDFGPDVAYDEDFDFGADEGLAKVEDTESKDPDPKATNEISEEQPPSFNKEPGLELVGEDHWDFLGINGFDPNVAYDEDFDFGTDEGSANVEPTASQDPDPKAIDREGTKEVVRVAREEEVSQDGGSSQVVTEPTSNDVDKAIPEESVGAHEDISQPARDSEPSPAVTPVLTGEVGYHKRFLALLFPLRLLKTIDRSQRLTRLAWNQCTTAPSYPRILFTAQRSRLNSI